MDSDARGRFRVGDTNRRLIWSRRIREGECTHIDTIQDVTPSADGCEECLEMGDTWVHLRLCLFCGYVGCCNESKNKHATKHFQATHHPIMMSFEPGEDWLWCYVDQMPLSSRKVLDSR